MNKQVHLSKLIQTPKGPRYCPAVLAKNGRVKPDQVKVKINGLEEQQHHPEGNYYISWYEGKKLIRRSVGKDAQDAAFQRSRKQAELNAVNHGVLDAAPAAPSVSNTNGHKSLADAVIEYLEEIKLTKKSRTHAAYATSLAYFQESCQKLYVQDIERRDLLKFTAFLRDEKEQSPRSVYNKFESVMSFLKTQGIRGLVQKNDWPRYTETEPEVYSDAELQKFFAACDEQEHLWFDFLLKTAMREQEWMHCSWDSVNFEQSSVSVQYNAKYDWHPKTYTERRIPLPKELTQRLAGLKAKSDKSCGLLFPTSGCRPRLNLLDCCKAIAKRAGLNPADWWLHKFRATQATKMLQKGIDLKSVQRFLGHKDLESTMRYLAAHQNDVLQKKVEEIW